MNECLHADISRRDENDNYAILHHREAFTGHIESLYWFNSLQFLPNEIFNCAVRYRLIAVMFAALLFIRYKTGITGK